MDTKKKQALWKTADQLRSNMNASDYKHFLGMFASAEGKRGGEPFDGKMARLTGELSGSFARSNELEAQIRQRLGAIGYDI